MNKPRLNPKKHLGYIECRRLDRLTYIDIGAFPHPNAGWLCRCGNWTKLDPYYHDVLYNGVKE